MKPYPEDPFLSPCPLPCFITPCLARHREAGLQLSLTLTAPVPTYSHTARIPLDTTRVYTALRLQVTLTPLWAGDAEKTVSVPSTVHQQPSLTPTSRRNTYPWLKRTPSMQQLVC